MNYKVYRAILIEPEPIRRARLREVAAAAPCFDQVEACVSTLQAIERLSHERCDVVFMGNLNAADIPGFIEQGKSTEYGRLAAFVTLLDSKYKSDAGVAANTFTGADGVLFEPYSVDNLVDTTKIADRLKEVDANIRKQAALKLLLDNVVEEVDKFGLAMKSNESIEARSTIVNLRKIGEQVVQATKSLAVDYLGVISKSFSEASPPNPYVKERQNYGGVSKRVQQILDRKKKALEKSKGS